MKVVKKELVNDDEVTCLHYNLFMFFVYLSYNVLMNSNIIFIVIVNYSTCNTRQVSRKCCPFLFGLNTVLPSTTPGLTFRFSFAIVTTVLLSTFMKQCFDSIILGV